MKKLIILLLILFSYEAYSQALLPKRRIFSAGASMPVGDFQSNGYATPGFTVSYERTSYLLWYLGIGSVLSYQTQNIDEAKLANDLREVIPNSTDVQVENRGYSSIHFMYGAYGRLPFNEEKWEFHLKAGAGVALGAMGETKVIVSTQADEMSPVVVQEDVYAKDSDFKLGYYIGTGVQFNALGKHLGLRLNAEYVDTPMSFRMRPSQQLLSEDLTNNNGFQYININLGLMIKIL